MKFFSILSHSFSINGQCELWNSVGAVPKCCYFRIRRNPLARTGQPLLCLNIILEVLYLILWLMGLDIALSRCAPERPCYPLRERNHYHRLRKGIGAHSQGVTVMKRQLFCLYFILWLMQLRGGSNVETTRSVHSFLILYFEHF